MFQYTFFCIISLVVTGPTPRILLRCMLNNSEYNCINFIYLYISRIMCSGSYSSVFTVYSYFVFWLLCMRWLELHKTNFSSVIDLARQGSMNLFWTSSVMESVFINLMYLSILIISKCFLIDIIFRYLCL